LPCLLGTPWSVRLACGSADRPALEVYAARSLIDVVVASSRASQLLRGACTAVIAGQAHTIAWGCLTAARSELPSVRFLRRRIRRRAQPAEPESVIGWFWIAAADGLFTKVLVTSRRECRSCRARTADAC